MAKGFEGRLMRLELIHGDLIGLGCRHCRAWSHVLYRFDDGVEDPPPFCPECGRCRPTTYAVREYALPADFDAEVIHDQAS